LMDFVVKLQIGKFKIAYDEQTQSLITKKLSGGHNGGLDRWWWWSSSSSSCVGAWFGNLVLVKMMMIDVRQLDEWERERSMCYASSNSLLCTMMYLFHLISPSNYRHPWMECTCLLL
jgi:hypothetical protein